VLLTGPFGGLTDDVREFLRCLDGDGLLLTGWGELDPASLRTVRERLPGGGAGGDGPDGLALAWRRTTLLRSLCDAGRLSEADAGMLQLTELGRLLWHERDALLQELAGLPPGQVELAGFAHRFWVLVGHRWPSVAAAADAGEWRQALWSTALAPLAMLGALDLSALPGRRHPQLTAPPGVPVAPRW